MDQNKLIEQARKLAEKAKPGVVKIEGKLYTLVFCQREWVYQVYEDGFWLVNFNTKQLTKAKKYLRDWLVN